MTNVRIRLGPSYFMTPQCYSARSRADEVCPECRRSHPLAAHHRPFALALALIVALLQLDLIEYAYERIGVAPQYVLGLLLAPPCSAAPSTCRSPAPPHAGRRSTPAGTILAVNLGGAVIPTASSAYLLVHGAAPRRRARRPWWSRPSST